MCDFKSAAGPEAATTWETLRAAKDIKDFATKYADLYDMDSAKCAYLEQLFTVVLGYVDEGRYYKMCAAFGGATKSDSMIKWIASELWDANDRNVVAFFHPHLTEDDMKKKASKAKHGEYLLCFHETKNSISLARATERNGRILVAKGKLTSRGVGKGWTCAETKKSYKNLAEYFKARGPDGDGRLLAPIPRYEKAKGKPNIYAENFDDHDDEKL